MVDKVFKLAIRAETSEFGQDIDRAIKKLNTLGTPEGARSLGGIGRALDTIFGTVAKNFSAVMGTAIAGTMTVLLAKGFRAANEIRRIMGGTGLNATQARGLLFAADSTGTDLKTITGPMEHLRRAQGEALGGSGEKIKAFQDLGITFKELSGSTFFELFTRLSAQMANGSLDAVKYAAAVKILGENFQALADAASKGLVSKMGSAGPFAPSAGQVASAQAGSGALSESWNGIKGFISASYRNISLGLSGASNKLATAAGATVALVFGQEDAAIQMFSDIYGYDQAEALERIKAMQEKLANKKKGRETLLKGAKFNVSQEILGMDMPPADEYARSGRFLNSGASVYTQNLIQMQKRVVKTIEEIKSGVDKLNNQIDKKL